MSSESSFPIEEISEETLLPRLRTVALGRCVLAFGRCESTNLFARRLIEGRRNPPPEHGTLVIADLQTGGRGRSGRFWVAPQGSALLFSLILAPAKCTPFSGTGGTDPFPETEFPDAAGVRNDPTRSNRITMAAATAVVRALSRIGAPGCAIKWPNDVLAPDGRKLCGILTERVACPDAPDALITGIGINVNQTEADFPPELRSAAASVSMVKGKPVSRLALLQEILEELERCLALPEESLFEAWERNCGTLGRNIRVRTGGREIFGLALGLEKDGNLILRLETGKLEIISAGDIEILRTTPRAEREP